MSRAVSGRRSAIRNATRDSWRISLSVSWLTRRRAYRSGLCRGLRPLEVLVRRAVVPVRERCALARLSLPGRGAAAGHAAVERTGLDLLLDEADRRVDALADGPGDLSLDGDREIAANIL